ncbi:hypothetical protein CATRI_11135 [Corynebacterium atrinae]|uniref:hypothetical protein n=1 Tax=Corynebacterium atrinae TaxID=1336740 RepID=UPI0025B39DFC|nr:hypothetical protein [Corynebacterium atrinae]WJY64277.1 hypothetical protein CATRI_11135 [Corynebacterium atrinae]
MDHPTVIWSQVEKDFFIASTGSSVVGYVRGSDSSSFSAFDTSSHKLGQYTSFEDAARAVAIHE